MTQIDKEFSSMANSSYLRFVDDILILCAASDVESIWLTVTKRLLEDGFVVHPRGTEGKSSSGAVRARFAYLGYQFEWPRVTVRGGSVDNLKQGLVSVLQNYNRTPSTATNSEKVAALKRCELWLNLRITGCTYEGSRRGWISFYSQIRHQQLLRHLDWYVQHLLYRFSLHGRINAKSFVKAYRYAAQRRTFAAGYVPNFDNLSADDARAVLVEYFGMDAVSLGRTPDLTVAEVFRRRMHQLATELERDVTRLY